MNVQWLIPHVRPGESFNYPDLSAINIRLLSYNLRSGWNLVLFIALPHFGHTHRACEGTPWAHSYCLWVDIVELWRLQIPYNLQQSHHTQISASDFQRRRTLFRLPRGRKTPRKKLFNGKFRRKPSADILRTWNRATDGQPTLPNDFMIYCKL